MNNTRIIPLLHIKGPNIVKPIHTEALRVVGNPKELAERYYAEGADEVIYLDIVASLYQRNLDFELLKSVAENVFVPFTVGGGIRTIADINNALHVGADKVAINTHAVRNPEFLKEAVHHFGSQSIVLYIEAKKVGDKKWEAYTDGGRERSGVDVIEWVKQAIDLGVGEILVTSIDHDGTRKGYELELVNEISAIVPIPVIAHGGAGSKESFEEVIKSAHADAVSASSVFHYKDVSIVDVKKYLNANNLNVRI